MLSFKYTTFKLTNFKVVNYIIRVAISIYFYFTLTNRTFRNEFLFILYTSFEMAFIVAFVINYYLYYLFIFNTILFLL